MLPEDADLLRKGRKVVQAEADAIGVALRRLGPSFPAAVRIILECKGRVAVTGMGKAGDIGRKIQTTLASTGTPAYYLHPADALHGDLGAVCPEDAVVALSKSGETKELVALLSCLDGIGCRIALLTAKPDSKCAALSEAVIDIGDSAEACPLGLAPSSSTAAMLALGDALALTVMDVQGLRPNEYAARHPEGALGLALMKVGQIMRVGDDCPVVHPTDTVAGYHEALGKAPRRAGAAAVVEDGSRLVGFFTHGDFVRCFQRRGDNPLLLRLSDVMTRQPKTVSPNDLVSEALRTMRAYEVDELPVVGDGGRLLGLVDIQDLLAHGFSA